MGLGFFTKPARTPAKEEEFDSDYYAGAEESAPADTFGATAESAPYEAPAPAPRKVYNPGAVSGAPMQMKLVRPTTYEDGQIIAGYLMNNHPVLMHLENTTKEVAHDLAVYLDGVVFAICGHIQVVSENTIMLSPSSMDIAEEVFETEAPPADDGSYGGYGEGYAGGYTGYGY